MRRLGTMMHYFSLFLMIIVFPQQLQCQIKMECTENYPSPIINYKNICVQVNNTGPCEMWDTDIDVVKNQKVDVTFKVTSRNCTLYKFQLIANETIDYPNCVNTSRKYITDVHSEMTLNVLDEPCDGITCGTGEMVNVTFEDVPTGCYKLYYCTLSSKSRQICGQIVKYLNTNIKVNETVKYQVPRLTPSCIEERNEAQITVSRYTKFDEIQLSLRRDNNTQFCNSSSSDQLTVWIGRNVNRTLMCRRPAINTCFSSKMAGNEICHKIECYEERENNSIKCEFKQIPPGNYCVHMHIDDANCSSDCDFHSPFEMKPMIMTTQDVQSAMSLAYVALAVGVVGLLLISVIVTILICRRKWNNPQRVVIADDDHSWLQSQEILLLYPLDCKAFMDTMSTFRQIIEDMTGCKVFDCFDPQHSENLSLNKMDWMRKHLLCYNMKVIIVETACAALHQRALIQHSRLIYKEPMWLDDLFLLGLKLLTDNSDRNNYQRVFVVSFDGFTGERESLKYLTPYTRYVIPRYLNLLLADLNVQNFQKNIIRMRDYENENLQRLELDLRNLINYRGQNPEYLQQMISIP